jgi:hypothetical protein
MGIYRRPRVLRSRPTVSQLVRKIPRAIYQTPAELDARIRRRTDDAMLHLPETEEHRAIMKEIAQLRMYADAKRLFASQRPERDR